MLRFMDDRPLRRWIAEAGIICIGAGALLNSGCAGKPRDGYSAAAATPGRARISVPSTDTPGRASLADRRGQRPASRQPAAGGPGARSYAPAGSALVANTPRPQPPKRPQPATPATPNAVLQVSGERPSNAGRARISNPPKATASKPTASKPTASANSRPAVAQTAPKDRPAPGVITQTSAKVAASPRRSKPPVITPAAAESQSSAAKADSGYERQRADRLMERAQLMLRNRFKEEALRLALVAEQLEKSNQAIYQPGEERPSDFVSRLQRSRGIRTNESPAASESSRAIVANRPTRRSTPVDPDLVSAGRGRVELTDIRPGWQSAPGIPDQRQVKVESVAGANAPGSKVQTRVTQLETAEGSESQGSDKVDTATQSVNAAGSQAADTADATSVETVAAAAPAPEASEVANNAATLPPDDLADVEPAAIADSNSKAATGWSASSIVGLVVGLAGLMGIIHWRRQERKHYEATKV